MERARGLLEQTCKAGFPLPASCKEVAPKEPKDSFQCSQRVYRYTMCWSRAAHRPVEDAAVTRENRA